MIYALVMLAFVWVTPLFLGNNRPAHQVVGTPAHGDPTSSPCCCPDPDPEECESNCTEPLPESFELTMPVSAFNPFQGCSESCVGLAGTFILTRQQAVGGICRWSYCMEDPCNSGRWVKYVLSYRLPNRAVLLLIYGLESCDDLSWNSWNEWQATIGGPGDIDCCTIDSLVDYFLDAATPNCSVFAAFRPRIKALC